MYKITEQGRSMIEMLGVLAIIGVLSIGGLQVVSRMQYEHKSTQLINDFSETILKIQKIAHQFDEGYSGAGMFVYKNQAYSANWNFKKADTTAVTFTGMLDSIYTIDGTSVDTFSITAENLDDDICIRLATSEIPNLRKLTINTSKIDLSKNKANLDTVSEKCNKGTGNEVVFNLQSND